jgi:uncharacterized protein with HEPN domain
MRIEEDQVHLQNIVNCINEIDGYVEGMDVTEFSRNEDIQAAVARNLQMIGNASQMISKETKLFYSEVNFEAFESLRFANYNVEVEHGYEAIWSIIENDLPEIRDEVLTITSQMNSSQRDPEGKRGTDSASSDAGEWLLD